MDQLYQYLGVTSHDPRINAVVYLIAAILVGYLVRFFLTKVVRRITRRTGTKLDDAILDILVPQVKWMALVIGFSLALRELSKTIPGSAETSLSIFGYAIDVLFAAGVLIVTILASKTISLTLEHVLEGYSLKTESDVSRELTPLLKRLANILAGFVGIIVVLERFGIQASSLLVFLGGGSVALALAAQDTLSNMIAGFVIMIDRPFRVGDRVKLPTGDVGDVYEIGLRSTKIQDFDSNLIISPNAELVKAQVVNYAYPVRLIRVLVEVGVAYGTDIPMARKVLVALAKKHPHILPDHEPQVFVMDLGDSAVLLRLIARTDDFTKKFEAETDLREQIHERFAKEGVEIPFPQRVVHFAPENSGKAKGPSKRTTVRRKHRRPSGG